jgi:predicted amidohydrolase/GNAT superfamily N-acetyltransferase
MEAIQKIELEMLQKTDYEELNEVMMEAYPNLPEPSWTKKQINTLIKKFPEGQIVIKINGQIAACALSIIVDYGRYANSHTYKKITGDYTFDTHDEDGDILYGIDVFVRPKYRGNRLGRRLYEYRKELCEDLNLEGIVFGGRIPNYFEHSDEMTPKQYIEKVKLREIHDSVLNFQLSNDFHVIKVLKGYLEGDEASQEYAVLLKWDNIYYEKPTKDINVAKTVIRLGLVQWQMRPYSTMKELVEQAEYFVDALSAYKSYFALFPEFFNAPLMAAYNDLSESEAIRKLAEFTGPLVEEFNRLSISYNINIITGSMPELVNGVLYNVGYLCKRNGTMERFEKIHVTPDEERIWGMKGGKKLQTFETDCGKIGILICYDVEFPELSRLLALEGMSILFVPFLTDTQHGFSRVRHTAQARAIENECYVAIAGSVGNIPKVHNMDMQYAESMVFSPCDFQFPPNGIVASATPNTEMVLISDVDIDLLKQLHNYGTVKNLKDRRTDIYKLKKA